MNPDEIGQAANRPAQDDGLIFSFVLLTHNDQVTLVQAQTLIEEQGGHILHVLPYQALIAKMPPQLLPQIALLTGVAGVYTQVVELATIDSYGPTARRFAGAWNSLITPPPASSSASSIAKTQSETHNDVFIAPDALPAQAMSITGSSSVTPGYYQTSEFMAGSVAVGIVMVESNGAIDPSTENWTADEKQLAFNEIMAALHWWTKLEPKAHLSFVYDDHFSNPLPTGVEPITRPFTDQQYWIGDAMKALGYNNTSYFKSVRDYDNALRTQYKTDWAFTIFVVDSSADRDNHFSDGYFAYAYLGGPFMVLTNGNNGYGPTNLDAVATHEMGHIFQALDQYSAAFQPCTRRSGYLDIENQNSEMGSCLSNVNSIMRGQIFPYTSGAIDLYSAGQIGWRDSDKDNILDPLDVQLAVTLDQISQNGQQITGSGMARITPYPSPNHPSVTINTLSSIKYRINNGNWENTVASDGSFDEPAEDYSFISGPLEPGLYLLEIAAFDSAGNISAHVTSTTIIIPDPFEPGPNTELAPPTHTIAGQSFSLNGIAYHTQGGQIAKVEFRVNQGSWQSAQAQDGLFNEAYEPFSLTFDLSQTGTYLVEAFAVDTAGKVEIKFASREIQVSQPRSSTIFFPIINRD